jgi:hypothetical protein
MRTSIRDPNNHDPKIIIVPDRGLAEYLHSLFPGSRIERIDTGIEMLESNKVGRPRKHMSNRHRVAHQRHKNKQKKIQILKDLLVFQNRQDSSMRRWGKEGPRYRAKTSIDSITDFGTVPPPRQNPELLVSDFIPEECCGTSYSHKTAPMPLCYFRWINDETFVEVLKTLHHRDLKTKEQNFLISPAVFDPTLAADTRRGNENIVYLRNLWLDFEKGDLQPEEFPLLFPQVRMVVMNTFHHTSEKPRFRVVIPTTQPVPRDAYSALYDQIAAKVEDAGYGVDRSKKNKKFWSDKPSSGLDWSKRLPTSLFYLPCQAEDPRHSFFIDYNDSGRVALDPLPWIENGPVPLQPKAVAWSEPNDQKKEIDQGSVNSAIRDWRQTPKGHGNDSFFLLAAKLKNAGMNPGQIEATLEKEATDARSPTERKQQIPSIMKSLGKKRL